LKRLAGTAPLPPASSGRRLPQTPGACGPRGTRHDPVDRPFGAPPVPVRERFLSAAALRTVCDTQRMIRGTLIAASLRLNDPLDAVRLLVQKINRAGSLPISRTASPPSGRFSSSQRTNRWPRSSPTRCPAFSTPPPTGPATSEPRQRHSSSAPDASSVTRGATTRGESERSCFATSIGIPESQIEWPD
jgi:hypothetical protein